MNNNTALSRSILNFRNSNCFCCCCWLKRYNRKYTKNIVITNCYCRTSALNGDGNEDKHIEKEEDQLHRFTREIAKCIKIRKRLKTLNKYQKENRKTWVNVENEKNNDSIQK